MPAPTELQFFNSEIAPYILGPAVERTIVDGAFDATGLRYVRLLPEGGVDDELTNITGGVDGQLMIVEYGAPSYSITVVAVGITFANMELSFANLGDLHKAMIFLYSADLGKWICWTQLVDGIQATNGITEILASDSNILCAVLGFGSWIARYRRLDIVAQLVMPNAYTYELTGNTDDWDPEDLTAATIMRLSTDGNYNLSGLIAGVNGRVLPVYNVGAFNLVLVHDATSTEANRFLCPGNANFTLTPNSCAHLWYDGASSRWRVS